MYYWKGKSEIDGKPIICVFTGFKVPSSNIKTGDMIQTTIIREDINPLVALKTGDDVSVCGTCIRRPIYQSTPRAMIRGKKVKRCYVKVWRFVLPQWKAYMRGRYKPFPESYTERKRLFEGKDLRIGSYGDPGAMPQTFWDGLLQIGMKHTGYTHRWDMPVSQNLKFWTMASTDTPEESIEAEKLGWRVFEVEQSSDLGHKVNLAMTNKVMCPASKEGGMRLLCNQCFACGGTSTGRSSVKIVEHV